MGCFQGAQPAGDVTSRVRPLVRVFFGAATVVALLLVVASSRPYEPHAMLLSLTARGDGGAGFTQ